jgi:hypothetical protein
MKHSLALKQVDSFHFVNTSICQISLYVFSSHWISFVSASSMWKEISVNSYGGAMIRVHTYKWKINNVNIIEFIRC